MSAPENSIEKPQVRSWTRRSDFIKRASRVKRRPFAYRCSQNLPDHFDALHLLGLSKSDTDELVEAEAILQRALQVDPKSAELLSNLGVVQSDMGQIEKARASYEKAIALRPNSPVALNNLGNALFKLNLPERAIRTFDRALSFKPDYIDAVYNRGNALLITRRFDEALQAFERVIRANPLNALAYNGIGLTYLELKRFDEAMAGFDHVLRVKPDLPQALANRGRALVEIGDMQAAFEHFEKARVIAPELEVVLLGHARLFIVFGRLSDALKNCQRAVRNDPRSVEALTILAQCVAHQGKTQEAIELFDRALALRPDTKAPSSGKSSRLISIRARNFRNISRSASNGMSRLGPRFPGLPAERLQNVYDPNRRLRVGYVSGDFRDHSAALVFGPVLRNHDKSVVEIFCYSCTSLRDKVTDEFQRDADKWVDAWRLTDDQLAEQIMSDRIDILVDLSGFTGGNRLRCICPQACSDPDYRLGPCDRRWHAADRLHVLRPGLDAGRNASFVRREDLRSAVSDYDRCAARGLSARIAAAMPRQRLCHVRACSTGSTRYRPIPSGSGPKFCRLFQTRD